MVQDVDSKTIASLYNGSRRVPLHWYSMKESLLTLKIKGQSSAFLHWKNAFQTGGQWRKYPLHQCLMGRMGFTLVVGKKNGPYIGGQ